MKVAVLSPVCWRTPPRHYGPWEQVASNIAEGLVNNGIDVTLFASGDSITKGNLKYICEFHMKRINLLIQRSGNVFIYQT